MTNRFWMIPLCLLIVAAGPAATDAKDISICPTTPASLSVTAGKTTLTFDGPEIRAWATDKPVPAPRNHAAWYEPWEPWPRRGQDKKNNTIELGPRRDETNTQILGGLFRSIQPESVMVMAADKSRTFTAGEDYVFNAPWGQIANRDGRLGEEWTDEVYVTCRYATQRLDLIQRDTKGRFSVKKGKPIVVCPALPAPDAGCESVAGVYIAPWRQGEGYVITAENILPIDPAPPVAPINPGAVAATLKRLRAGEPTRIALMGASITAGAEATRWWDKDTEFTAEDKAYRGRLIHGLRTRFPSAEITPVTAYRGGTTTQYGIEKFKEVVAPAKPHLVLICFGGNDANGPIGKGPNNPPEKFRELMSGFVAEVKKTGCDVMLVTTMPRNPWLKNGVPTRTPVYNRIQKKIASEQDAAVADVYAAWSNLTTRGVPPYTQLHNWNNHPGDFGHQIFAETILRFFEPAE